MTITAHFVLSVAELLLVASPGLIAVRLVFGGRDLRMQTRAGRSKLTDVDPEMLRIADWSDELQPPACAVSRSCEL